VGKIVMKAAAENITPVLLELGGQNPALVDATANISDAAKK
jgi:aldehyde dehydrogenase (NAD+)